MDFFQRGEVAQRGGVVAPQVIQGSDSAIMRAQASTSDCPLNGPYHHFDSMDDGHCFHLWERHPATIRLGNDVG
jgi:hypothetical protein